MGRPNYAQGKMNMTTEIAIMNKRSVILASDSAVTTANNKVFSCANKIFSLSKHHPVGIMVYNSADFMGIPMETIIKKYRESLQDKSFPTIKDYAEDFLIFLREDKNIKNNTYSEESYIEHVLWTVYRTVLNAIDSKMSMFHYQKGRKDDSISYSTVAREVVKEILAYLESTPKYHLFNEKNRSNIEKKYQKIFEKYYEAYQIYPKFKLSQEEVQKLVSKYLSHQQREYTGIVFAGFGEEEIFPSYESYHISGILDEVLLYTSGDNYKVGADPLKSACLKGFAQDDIIKMFLSGVHPNYLASMETFYSKAIEKTKESFGKEFMMNAESLKILFDKVGNDLVNNIRQELNFFGEQSEENIISNMLSNLPPVEMAELAEALVNITTVQRQLSPQQSTVGGPTDVAMITKGDGLIWIKRKHYFEPKLNHHFFTNYFKGGCSE